MTKRSTKRRDPLARAKPHPRFGATKAQAARHDQTRDLKNRIHDLEQTEAALRETVSTLSRQLEASWKLSFDLTPTQERYAAVKRIASMPTLEVVSAGLQREAVVLAEWLKDWDAQLASGKAGDLICRDCVTRHSPGKHPVCKPVGKRVVVYRDASGNVIREEAL